MAADRTYRAWYTHEFLQLSHEKVLKRAKELGIEIADPDNPTQEELQEVFHETFAEMSDPWEVTANGECKVEPLPAKDG
jgi:phosphatidylethanolamine-binding protein (PEBP) family uncharacterized protein